MWEEGYFGIPWCFTEISMQSARSGHSITNLVVFLPFSPAV